MRHEGFEWGVESTDWMYMSISNVLSQWPEGRGLFEEIEVWEGQAPWAEGIIYQ